MKKLLRLRTPAGPAPRAEINVTPLVDVVLVLLIIFMVVTPFLRPVEVELPRAAHAEQHSGAPVVLTVRADGVLFLGGEPVEVAELGRRVHSADVLVRADGALPYAVVRHVMEELAGAGIEGIDLATIREED